MISLESLNTLPVEVFTDTLGAIFEHSSWVAQRAAVARPFASRLDLLDAMRTVVRDAPLQDQLSLIRAHPQLGARGRKRRELTEASSREQRRAGLDACSDAEFAELMRLNTEYVGKFDFPFILAVRGHDPASILAFMRTRLNNSLEEERHTALTQIGLIGGYRLADLVSSSAAAEVLAMQARALPDAAAPGAPAAASLLREWMLAAGLDTHAGMGFTPASSTNGLTSDTSKAHFIFGVYVDPTSAGATTHLRRDGSLGSLLGVAIAHSLRLKQQPSRYGLLVFPFPRSGRQGSILPDAATTALQEHTSLPATQINSLTDVAAAGITERCVVISSPTPHDDATAPPELSVLERTVTVLETFLTQP